MHVILVALYMCITQVQSSHTRCKARGKSSSLGRETIEISVKKKKKKNLSSQQNKMCMVANRNT